MESCYRRTSTSMRRSMQLSPKSFTACHCCTSFETLFLTSYASNSSKVSSFLILITHARPTLALTKLLTTDYRLLKKGVLGTSLEVSPWVHTSSRLELSWLPTGRRREYLAYRAVFKAISTLTSDYIAKHFTLLDLPVIQRSLTRNFPSILIHGVPRTESWVGSFVNLTSDLLNSFDSIEIDLGSLDTFQRVSRAILFRRDIDDWSSRIRNEGLDFDFYS